MIILLVIAVVPMYAQPVAAQEPGAGMAQRAFFEVDRFTYRAAFELADGTEVLLLRSSYKVNFLYQHHQPTLNEHYMTVSMAFYYGKTALGRPLIQNLTFDSMAFYPKWRNSAGYYFDRLDSIPVFSHSGTFEDGKMFGGFLLLDNDAISQYLPMFGGYIVFEGLKMTLIDGSVLDYSDTTLTIDVEKYSNEVYPRNATLTGDDVEYTSADGYIHINTLGVSQPIIIIDMFVALSILSTAGIAVVLGVLHIKGRITLPISRLRGIVNTSEAQKKEI